MYLEIESIHEYKKFEHNQYWYYGHDITIIIPFGEKYPAKWMKLLIEKDPDVLFVVDECKIVIPYKICFKFSDKDLYIPGISP